jgi:hypothetical protein
MSAAPSGLPGPGARRPVFLPCRSRPLGPGTRLQRARGKRDDDLAEIRAAGAERGREHRAERNMTPQEAQRYAGKLRPYERAESSAPDMPERAPAAPGPYRGHMRCPR